MRLLAALSAAVAAYLAAGYLAGHAPRRIPFALAPRRRGPGRQEWLAQSGALVTPAQFWLTSLAAGGVTFALVYLVTGTLVVAVLPAVAVAVLPRRHFAKARARLAGERVEAWPDALRSITASLAAALSLHESLVALRHSGPPALRPVFERYARLSGSLDQRAALEVVREELADPVSDRVVEVLILAVEQGPSIVLEVLTDLAKATTLDLQLAQRVETAQLEQRLNARAVLVLPYVMLVLLCARDGAFRAFYGSSAGLFVVVVGGAMSLGGMAVINRLGRQPVEERVFGGAGG